MSRRIAIIYGLALVFALAIITSGFLIARQTRHELDDKLQQTKNQMKADNADGKLEPERTDEEIDQLTWNNFGMTVSRNLMLRIDLTMWIEEFWCILIPLVLAVCFVPAFVVDRIWRWRVQPR